MKIRGKISVTDIMVVLYGEPRDLDRWETEYRDLRRKNPKLKDSPMLAELRPRLLRFHPHDREAVFEFLRHYNPEGQAGAMAVHFPEIGFFRRIFGFLLGRGWRRVPELKNLEHDTKNGLYYVAAWPLFVREDSYKWGGE
jgi:hypothetical protein